MYQTTQKRTVSPLQEQMNNESQAKQVSNGIQHSSSEANFIKNNRAKNLKQANNSDPMPMGKLKVQRIVDANLASAPPTIQRSYSTSNNIMQLGKANNRLNKQSIEGDNKKPESLKELAKHSRYKSIATDKVLGVLFIITALVIFTFSLYAFIISKFFMPYTGNQICCLIPSTIVTTLLFMYVNWVAMKYFRHS
ncbi:hypothetical protein FGO68_gene13294 [Halteria grandinella]|uniref:Uncharacterized protein n=1 Tax=Halteria grandinella TaxID=5974 RepID=A0A8J8NMZ2_HALGN|nr:hypothetical protein FGO68_gene13294 [Halteria grandinella]